MDARDRCVGWGERTTPAGLRSPVATARTLRSMDALIVLHSGHWLPSVLAVLVPLLLVTGLLLALSRRSRRG